MAKNIRCHDCGSKMDRGVRPDTVTYKGKSVAVEQPGWYCTKCDEVVLDGPDTRITEAAFVRLKADVDGILTPGEVRSIREKLGISQREAGRILGGGPRSFQKYESGTDWVTRSMANLLRLLDADPRRLREIKGETGEARVRRKRTSRAQPQRASGGA